MIVKIQKRERSFVMVDKRPLNNRELSWKAKGLLTYLLSCPDDWQVSISHLSQMSKDGADAVKSALKELQKFGHATYERTRDKTGKVTGVEWTIHEAPQADYPLEAPQADYPRVGNPQVGYPRVGNPPQLIIYSNKKEETNNTTTSLEKTENRKKIETPLETPSVTESPPVALPPPKRAEGIEARFNSFAPSITNGLHTMKLLWNRGVRIQEHELAEYMESFKIEILGREKIHHNQGDFNNHFFSYAQKKFNIENGSNANRNTNRNGNARRSNDRAATIAAAAEAAYRRHEAEGFFD